MANPAPIQVFEERTTAERYRLYERFRDGSLELIATTDSPQGYGLALQTLHDEGEITEETLVGVLDGLEHKWIVSPFVCHGRTRR